VSWGKAIIIFLAVLIILDGIGSILIQYGQHHSITFDLERFGRSLAGVAIAALAYKLKEREGS